MDGRGNENQDRTRRLFLLLLFEQRCTGFTGLLPLLEIVLVPGVDGVLLSCAQVDWDLVFGCTGDGLLETLYEQKNRALARDQ